MERIRGLDTLRGVAAFWVFLSHAGRIPVQAVGSNIGLSEWVSTFLRQFVGILVNGVAAVVVFFVISGFCIHLSTRQGRLDLGPFLVRRFVRVGGPLLVAVGLGRLFFGRTEFLDAVLWSLYCELIYYFLYPWLSVLATRVSWKPIVAASFVAASVLICVPDDHSGYIWAYGVAWTWVLGLPSWLLGVCIAQALRHWPPRRSSQRALGWLVIWALSSVTLVLQFHGGVAYKYTLLPFTLVAAWFVLVELRAASSHQDVRFLEWLGTWSFSLYLCHKFVIEWAATSSVLSDFPVLRYLGILLAGCGFSLAFFFAVERPCHVLARALSARFPLIATLDTTWKPVGSALRA